MPRLFFAAATHSPPAAVKMLRLNVNSQRKGYMPHAQSQVRKTHALIGTVLIDVRQQ
jgi:hypothetical protein